MAVCVIAVYLCGMDDGSGHDYASDDGHLPLSKDLHLFNAIFGTLVHLLPIYESNFKCWLREKARCEKENCIRRTLLLT